MCIDVYEVKTESLSNTRLGERGTKNKKCFPSIINWTNLINYLPN